MDRVTLTERGIKDLNHVTLTEQDLKDLNHGDEIIITYHSIVDAMSGQVDVIDLIISPPKCMET